MGASKNIRKASARFRELDADEQSLELLYPETETWVTGHECAACREAEPE